MHHQLDREHLFTENSLDQWIAGHEHTWQSKVDGLPADTIRRGDPATIAADLAETYTIVVPTLSDQIESDPEESTVELGRGGGFDYDDDDDRGPRQVKGTTITFHVPFTGNADVFRYQSSEIYHNPPRATVDIGELHLSYFTSDHDAEGIKGTFDGDRQKIKGALRSSALTVEAYMNGLQDRILGRLQARKEKLGKDQSLAESIGFPLRRRADAPQTHVVPTVRRRVSERPLRGLPPASEPDPALDLAEYEHILRICSSMVSVMERSPRAFIDMDEESIRDHFLVQLNGQYEGQATGETFNGAGKTDILIRVGDRNIFIAECKFWGGPKSLEDALGQLLDYATWRDSKTAIFVFNRTRQLSTVVARVPEVVGGHAAFVQRENYASETGFRFTLKRPDDPERQLLLTVLVFEVPVDA
jgi:hypothetical protein